MAGDLGDGFTYAGGCGGHCHGAVSYTHLDVYKRQIYHVAIFRNWFSPPIFLLALFGLIVVGLLFSWMDARHHNFVNSWIAHALADSVIIIIGMHMFGMI